MSNTGGVVISPNVTKKKDQIDADGNKVKPFTKQVIEREPEPYKPTPEEIANMAKAATRPPGTPADALGGSAQPTQAAQTPQPQPEAAPKPAGGLAAQIKAMVNQAVQEALAGIDIKGLVAEAIKEAFKDISL